MTYPEAIRFLYDLRWSEPSSADEHVKLAADGILSAAELHHVAGTGVYWDAREHLSGGGVRVGLFPHRTWSRLENASKVNRRLISERAVVRLVLEMQRLLKEFPKDEHPTFRG